MRAEAQANLLGIVLEYKMELQHFADVTSVLQILFVLRVMFRVYVYWSCSDTYPVFRTRFSPSTIVRILISQREHGVELYSQSLR